MKGIVGYTESGSSGSNTHKNREAQHLKQAELSRDDQAVGAKRKCEDQYGLEDHAEIRVSGFTSLFEILVDFRSDFRYESHLPARLKSNFSVRHTAVNHTAVN